MARGGSGARAPPLAAHREYVTGIAEYDAGDVQLMTHSSLRHDALMHSHTGHAEYDAGEYAADDGCCC